ncbi:hypothetical protein D9M68_942920 [compost metagenome]
MCKRLMLACVISSLLLNSGCQSSLMLPTPLPSPAVECLPPPPPEAWWMQPRESDLTQRMLNEFSASLTTVTKD